MMIAGIELPGKFAMNGRKCFGTFRRYDWEPNGIVHVRFEDGGWTCANMPTFKRWLSWEDKLQKGRQTDDPT